MIKKSVLRRFLREEMKSIPNLVNIKPSERRKPFDFCFCQARFDMLMNIDYKFKVGAFFKSGEIKERNK